MNSTITPSLLLYFRSLSALVVLSLLVSACEPVPDAKLTDLSSFDDKHERDGLVHGNTAVRPPTDADNAKIALNGDNITLATAHVMAIKSERYQPAFRLEGVIIPHKQTTITLPQEGRLDRMLIKAGDTVKAGDIVGRFYQETITFADNPDNSSDDSSDDSPNGSPSGDDTIIDDTGKPADNATTDKQNTNKAENTKISEKSKNQSKNKEKTSPHEQADDTDDEAQTVPTPIITKTPFDVKSPMTGKIEAVFVTDKNTTHPKDTPVLVVFDERFVKFISPLPAEFADYLAVGDGVTFDTEDGRSFGGQIKGIIPSAKVHGMMDIHVTIKPEQAKKAKLTLDERVGGYVNYGQIEIGVLVPSFAIFDDMLNPMDLSELTKPPYRPATPRPAWLWTVGQDERLALSKIVIIEYQPESDQYLIAGIGLDGLIVLADLPKQAHGGRVRLK
ncbi:MULTISPECIES: efflux RND transporter periplasmic adaptor subunit [Moraxella]|uniref:Efflux transporter, RND family, MFP subunit n=1 Tax=Moraxella lacunata TaxID=477 RepID=A0A1B8Q2E3_MORLA|nr:MULTISPECIES: efflux RND transporter periplasmic adaptor subunit [Moraxella]MBE9577922.1 efflux RND transporter periplasmic adaptor subunit [Moraxella sp. K1664]MBE9587425.1 efflux RND transporter periplasmic adaptor subunit [Moraxella sp. K1630]MBE9590773.1 efflux RND transporter periplasmic adaptor subunit [Moraxella sp. K127]MBE9595668.1 efflux RND transporter periplasmic adaptor subunit [Moraxella sp. K2450]MDH9218723.1 efflux RND transporter periplasmic adaptor subunit [Moraxella lacun